MAGNDSKSAVILAIAGNAIITVGKGTAAVLSGSGALIAETVHSFVDTLNQCLLLVGYNRSRLAPTRKHPFGYGIEANFWGLLAAIGILVFGGGISTWHGIEALLHSHEHDASDIVKFLWVLVGVLIFSALVESYVLYSVIRGLAKTRGDKSWVSHVRSQPSETVTVLFEDAAAVLGCVIAFAAVMLCYITNNAIYDAIAQLIIGAMLTLVGLYLIVVNRGMLVGQAVNDKLHNKIFQHLMDLEGIDRVTSLRTRQISAHHFAMKAEIVFSGGELAGPLMREQLEFAAKAETDQEHAEMLGRYADALFIQQARYVDTLEERIRDEFPNAVYIDLEPHLRADDDPLKEDSPSQMRT
jgi:cation diffusion facilitator family transporter